MFRNIAIAVFGVIAALYVVNCSSSSGGASVASYQGAGSKWSATFSGGAFTINHFDVVTDTTPDMTVVGTYVDYSTGFRLLTVSSSTGSGGPTAGSQAYGFEVPGFAFFLKPVGGSNEEPIVMITAGTCPTGNFDANWIIASFDAGVTLDASRDSFGHANFVMNGASSSATIHQLNAANAGSLGSNVAPFDYTTCSGGVLTFSPSLGETVDMFFTAGGGALVHSYDGSGHDNIIFAAPKHSAAVTQADLAGTYSALVFDDNQSSNDKLFPMKIVIPSAGDGTANAIDDVSNDTLSSDPTVPVKTFTAVGASPGLFTAVIDQPGTDGRMSCTYTTVGSTKVIACNGYADGADITKPFFLLGKSR